MPKFSLPHFIFGLLSLCIIIPCIFFLYKYFFPSTFLPDIKEAQQLPPDVKKVSDEIAKTPLFASSSANPLYFPDLPKPAKKITPSQLRIPILLYHYVEYVKDRGDKIRISLNIEPHIFEHQVTTLQKAGYTFIIPSDIPDYFEGKQIPPSKPVILTFDDGYRDFYTDVFPILKKYNVKAISYVVPGFLDKPNNLTHKQLKEIKDNGLVEIGAHTVFHTYLRGLNQKRAKFEIEQSKAMLENELGIKVVSFAYPYGAFDLKTIDLVQEAGFKTSVSTVPGVYINLNNLFFIYRLRPGGMVDNVLLNFLEKAK